LNPQTAARNKSDGALFVIASRAKQSMVAAKTKMDCFAEPAIGRRFAPTRWLAMTG
jgi:hypothetical protein